MSGRSHYDVLGISPSAPTEAIRRGYLRQARRWHPDRPTGDSEQMRVVNEAWQVLGDPRSRAAYDRSLSSSSTGEAAPHRPTGASSPPSRPHSRPGAGSSPPPPTSPLEVVSIRWRWVSATAAALVALAIVLIVVATTTADDPDSATPLTASVPLTESRPGPGDCFLIGTFTLISVGCDHPHDGKLVRWVPLGAPCPPNTELHWVRSAQEAICYHRPSG